MKRLILVNGQPVDVDTAHLEAVREVEPGVYSVLLEGKSFEVRAAQAPDGLRMETAGLRFTTELVDPRNAGRRSKAAVGKGRQNISAAMPGKVVRVLVQENDAVDTGQGLVVVEAMKMQNEMKAARPGRVAEVRVRNGDTVAAGDTLVVLE